LRSTETKMKQADQTTAAVTALLNLWVGAFVAKDVDGLRNLWDNTYDGLIYQAEEFAGPLTTWIQIKHYYREVLSKVILRVERWHRTGLWIRTFGDTAYAYATTDFTMVVKNVSQPYRGTVRQTFLVRRLNDGWKIVHYHESLQSMATPENFNLDAPDEG
jgi:ketosteroid isomerase-like protein